MKNSTKESTIILYHNMEGKIETKKAIIRDMSQAEIIAKKLLKPYMHDEPIQFWHSSLGTNFVANNHGVLIKGFLGSNQNG